VVDSDRQYRAFISYSQQDALWGKRIHQWLETYRVPVGSVVDVQLPRRLGKFFRDDEDMAAASDIAVIVRQAIENAESLIVICSPRSAQSKWVNAEIHHFRRTGRARKVFAVIIDGVPNSGDPATECFPPALRAAGDPDDSDALPIEPLGLDIRKDGRAKACARLAAGLLDIDFDDLWQRDRRRAEVRQRILVGALIAVSTVFAVLTFTAISFAKLSERRAASLSIESARAALLEGHADGALLMLLEAAKVLSDTPTPDTLLIAFDEALQRASAEAIYPLPPDARLFDAPQGVFIVDPGAKTLSLLNASGPPRVVGKLDTPPIFVGQTSDGATIIVGSDFRIERRAEGTSVILGSFQPQPPFLDTDDPYDGRISSQAVTLSPDNMLLLQPTVDDGSDTRAVQVFDLAAREGHVVRAMTGWRVYYVKLPDGRRVLFNCCLYEEEGKVFLDPATKGRLPSAVDLLAYWCNGGARLPAGMRPAFARAAAGAMTAQCQAGGQSILFRTLQIKASVPERRFDLLEPSDDQESTEVRDRISPNIRALDTYYVHGPLQGRYDREFETVRTDGSALAIGSGRDLLVRDEIDPSSGVGPLYEWRMPKLLAYVQLLGQKRVAAVDQDIAFIHVFDYTTPHPYATQTLVARDEPAAAGERDPRDSVGGRKIEDEDLGDKVDGLYLYSQEAGRVFRRLGAQYKWPDAFFLSTGQVYTWAYPRAFILTPHDRAAATAAARERLSAHCRNFAGDNYRSSRCWPEIYAD
jgi:hypothetical protein